MIALGGNELDTGTSSIMEQIGKASETFILGKALMIQFFISIIISIVLISLLYYNSKRKEWRDTNEKSR